ncbi:MAG TPA: hypothetical protein VGP01_02780 [Rhizomicrobium sp.]|nr:hypothetical protein [Rhizomicrobium sp.]
MTDHALDLYGLRPRRPSNEEQRRRLIERIFTWGVVAIIHILMLFIVVQDQRHRRELAMRPPAETILDLSRLSSSEAPPIRLIRPVVPRAAPPEITTAPVVVVPPPPPNSQTAPPQTPADILKAIGEALSCGAENFENLTQAERSRCRHEPWIARKLPNGTIILEAAAPRAIEPEVPKISGADALRREMQTAPSGCSLVTNVPCMNPTPMITIPLN